MLYNAKNAAVKFCDTDMDYIRFGTGEKTLVMLPGLGDGLRCVKGTALPMAFLYREFAKEYTVYAFSRKNVLSEGYTTQDMARDQKMAMDAIGIDKADVFGVSMGGMIAQWLAIDYPEKVGKLVLVVTSARPNLVLTESVTEWIAQAKQGNHTALMDSNVRRIIIQRIILDLCFMSIGDHALQNTLIKDCLHQLVDTITHVGNIKGQRCQCPGSQIAAILICDLIIIVSILVNCQVTVDLLGSGCINCNLFAIHSNKLSGEVLNGCSQRAIIQRGLDIRLQVCNKVLIALTCNDCQHIDIMHRIAAGLGIHAIALLVDTQTKTAANFLPLGGLAIRMLQSTNLEHIGVVPAFTKGRVREDEPGRLFKTQQGLRGQKFPGYGQVSVPGADCSFLQEAAHGPD